MNLSVDLFLGSNRKQANFSGGTSPLLISVRSGAEVSMPGMMDTILNLGITSRLRKLWPLNKVTYFCTRYT